MTKYDLIKYLVWGYFLCFIDLINSKSIDLNTDIQKIFLNQFHNQKALNENVGKQHNVLAYRNSKNANFYPNQNLNKNQNFEEQNENDKLDVSFDNTREIKSENIKTSLKANKKLNDKSKLKNENSIKNLANLFKLENSEELERNQDSLARLVTDHTHIEGLMPHSNPIVASVVNITESIIHPPAPIVTTAQHLKQNKSIGNRFLSSISPEEFLKRLKRHLQISKSNLRILKKNFQDFLKEKENLFQLTRKVSKQYETSKTNAKCIHNCSVVHIDRDQEVSYVRDTQDLLGLPILSATPVEESDCPKECPVSTINIAHHHHGRSPIPCICEEDYMFPMMIDQQSISDSETFPMKSYKKNLSPNPVAFHPNKNILINIPEVKIPNVDNNYSKIEIKEDINGVDNAQTHNENIMNTAKDGFIHPIIKVEDIQIQNKIIPFANMFNQEPEKKNSFVQNDPKFYGGCDSPTTHIPAACDVPCVPCKPKCPTTCPTTCSTPCPTTCPPKCPTPKCCPTKCPPTCKSTCPPVCLPTCRPKCPKKCSCGNLQEENSLLNNNMNDQNSKFIQKIMNAAFRSDKKIDENDENLNKHSNDAKITMEQVKCTTECPSTCYPPTCKPTCPTTCCTTQNNSGRYCPSCLRKAETIQKRIVE